MQRSELATATARYHPRIASVAAATLAALLAIATAGHADDPDTAQSLLFDAPYLRAFEPPAELHYRFEHATSNEAVFGTVFADGVLIDIRPPEEPATLNSVELQVFTGERARTVGPLADVKGNPLTMLFLERDLFHMRRQVQASPVLFRNTMRRAMRNDARVEDTEISFAGKMLPAKLVTVRPFAGQNSPPQFAALREKVYVFTVASGIPGGIYEIRSTLPGSDGGSLVEDRVTFVGTRP